MDSESVGESEDEWDPTPKEARNEEQTEDVVDNNEEIKIQTAAERTIALIRDEVELEKLKEELVCFEKEKKELEETISNRNKEIYELNERIIVLEYKASLFDSTKEEEDPNMSLLKEMQTQISEHKHRARISKIKITKLKECMLNLKANHKLEEIRKEL